MHRIVNAHDHQGGIEESIRYIHSAWGNEQNFDFYRDAILHSFSAGKALPRFFLMLDEKGIAGCSALLLNDLISRQDLFPWFACLYIEESRRGMGLGGELMAHGRREAARCGFDVLYLSTGHDGYYERYGWTRIEDGYELTGRRTRIYMTGLDRPDTEAR